MQLCRASASIVAGLCQHVSLGAHMRRPPPLLPRRPLPPPSLPPRGANYADESPMVLGRGQPPEGLEGTNDTRYDTYIPGPPKGGYRFKSIAPALNSVLGLLEDDAVTAQDSGSSGGGLSGGAIAGIAVGAVAAAALLAGGVWVAYSRRRVEALHPTILPIASGKGCSPEHPACWSQCECACTDHMPLAALLQTASPRASRLEPPAA